MAVIDEVVLARAPSRGTDPGSVRRPVWWREALFVTAFYLAYAHVRNARGRHEGVGAFTLAQQHAYGLIHLERALGLFHERALQSLAMQSWLVIRAANGFYTTAHFVVTLGVLVWLFHRHPVAYRRWRWVLAGTTAIALVGFAVFPTLPPRLLPAHFGFVDTLGRLGGLWTFNSGAIERISDPFAAMPSLHLGWAAWCAVSVWTTTRSRRVRTIAVAYPIVTAAVVIVTGNHYLIDVVAGVAVFAMALGAMSVLRLVRIKIQTWQATRRVFVA